MAFEVYIPEAIPKVNYMTTFSISKTGQDCTLIKDRSSVRLFTKGELELLAVSETSGYSKCHGDMASTAGEPFWCINTGHNKSTLFFKNEQHVVEENVLWMGGDMTITPEAVTIYDPTRSIEPIVSVKKVKTPYTENAVRLNDNAVVISVADDSYMIDMRYPPIRSGFLPVALRFPVLSGARLFISGFGKSDDENDLCFKPSKHYSGLITTVGTRPGLNIINMFSLGIDSKIMCVICEGPAHFSQRTGRDSCQETASSREHVFLVNTDTLHFTLVHVGSHYTYFPTLIDKKHCLCRLTFEGNIEALGW